MAEEKKLVAKVNGRIPCGLRPPVESVIQQSGIPRTTPKDRDAKMTICGKRWSTLSSTRNCSSRSQEQKLLARRQDRAETETVKKRFPTRDFPGALKQTGSREGLQGLLARSLSIQSVVEQDIAKDVAVSDAEIHDFYAGKG